MKTRILTMLAALLLISIGAFAQQVSESDALQKAQAFMQGKFEAAGGSRRAPRRMQRVPKAAENDAFYIFNAEDNGGFVIVSGDERTDEILGYSTEGNIDLDKMPENMRAWLKGYEEQINSLQPNAKRAPSYVPVHPAVEPLITSKWTQGSPYNLQCPMQTPEGSTEPLQCITGCVATAMAQIMYYWKWPQGMTTAIPAYDDLRLGEDKKTHHIDALPPTTFEWNLMKDTYNGNETGAEAQAVAELMRYCGQSVQMHYTPTESGADLSGESLINYFGYDKRATIISRLYNSISDWDSLIYHEIEKKRPVWYTARPFNNDPGHCFVCDGYDGNGCYHINWGWGGYADGYYRLSIMAYDPSGSDGIGSYYNTDSYAIIGIQPPNTDDEVIGMLYASGFISLYSGGYMGENGEIGRDLITITNKTNQDIYFDAKIVVRGTNGTDYYKEYSIFTNEFISSYLSLKYLFPITLSCGYYSIVPYWKKHSESNWHMGGRSFVWNDGNGWHYSDFTDRTDVTKNWHIDGLEGAITNISSSLINEEQILSVAFSYSGDESLTQKGIIAYCFASPTEEKIGGWHSRARIYVADGGQETYKFTFTPYSEGLWHIWITTDPEGNNVVAQTDMLISKPLNISMSAYSIDWSTMTITVTNHDEVAYDHEVAVRIYPCEDYGKEDVGQVFKSGKLHIEPGQSIDVDIDCAGLSIDNLYLADLMYCRNPNSDVMSKVWITDVGVVGKDHFTVNGIQYVIADTERHYVFAESCNSGALQQLTVPSTVVFPNDGVTYTVKGISRFFCQYNDVTTLSFSYGITTIDNYAVQECESLETIVLPGSLKCIKAGMVYQCPNLKAIYSKAHEAPLVVDCGVSNYLIGWDNKYDNITLYVPKGSRASYAKAWPQFTNIVEMDVEAMPSTTKTLEGDMNGDGKRSLVDVVILVNKIMEER